MEDISNSNKKVKNSLVFVSNEMQNNRGHGHSLYVKSETKNFKAVNHLDFSAQRDNAMTL